MQHKTKYGLDVSVEIIRDIETDNARIKVLAPMYMKKEFFLGHSYKSSEFSDYQILNDSDFKRYMLSAFGQLD